jgi:hypothetical protein
LPYELMTDECMRDRLDAGDAWPVAGYAGDTVECEGHRWVRSGEVWVKDEAPGPARSLPGRGPSAEPLPAEPPPFEQPPPFGPLPGEPLPAGPVVSGPLPAGPVVSGRTGDGRPGSYWLEDLSEAAPAGGSFRDPGERTGRHRHRRRREPPADGSPGGRHRLPAIAASAIFTAAVVVAAVGGHTDTQTVSQPRLDDPAWLLPSPAAADRQDRARPDEDAGPAADAGAAGASGPAAAAQAAAARPSVPTAGGAATPAATPAARPPAATGSSPPAAANTATPAAPASARVRGALAAVRSEITRADAAGQLEAAGRIALRADVQGIEDALAGRPGKPAVPRAVELRKRIDDLAKRKELRGSGVTKLRAAADRLRAELQPPPPAARPAASGARPAASGARPAAPGR